MATIRLHEEQERAVLLSPKATLMVSEDRHKNRIESLIKFVKISLKIYIYYGFLQCANCISNELNNDYIHVPITIMLSY